MDQNQKWGKISKKAICVGVLAIVISVLCFVVLGVVAGKIEEWAGYKPNAEEIKELIKSAEETAEFFGWEIQDVADSVGISALELTLVRVSLALKTPTLIFGLIALLGGLALKYFTKNPGAAKKLSDGVSQGATSVSGAIKTTIDNAMVKCEKCGKSYVAGTKFCSNCGNALESKTLVPKKKVCPACGAIISDKSKFCSKCGVAVVEDSTSHMQQM